MIPTKKYHVELYQRWLEIPEVANVIVLYNGSSNLQMHTSNRIHIEHCNWIGHGATRNLALQKIRSKYVFFTVDDAIPLSSTLSPLVDFLNDIHNKDISAIVARQCPSKCSSLCTAE